MDAAQGVGMGIWHARGEAAIRASGAGFTFIRPTGFMSNALYWAKTIRAEGVVRSSTGEGKIGFIHPDDIAEVTVAALLGKHLGETLPITGPEALSYAEMTDKIGAAIGRELTFETISDDDARRLQITWGASPEVVDARLGIFGAIRDGRLAELTGNVERVTGRTPTSFDRWAALNASAFR